MRGMKTKSALPGLAKRFALMLSVTACGAVTARAAEHYEAFLLAGQSNMDGRGNKGELKGDLAQWARQQTDVLIAFHGGGLKRPLSVSDGLQPLEPGYSGGLPKDAAPGDKFVPGKGFGPEVSFGAAMAKSLGKKVLLIKCSEGGTNLRNDWSPNQRSKLYDQFIAFTQQTLKDVRAKGDTFTLRGMIWHQGEGDAGPTPGAYQNLLAEFSGRVRADLQTPELPFVIGELGDDGKGKRDVVRADQKATAAAVPHTAFASAEGVGLGEDKTHFTSAGQIEFGKRFAQAMLTLLQPGKQVPPNK
ncbi:MAG: sialate O-acetylesterase [bacterium]